MLARPAVLADLRQGPYGVAQTAEEWERFIPTLFWLSGRDVARFVGQAPLITDDRPIVEYFLLRRMVAPPSPPMIREHLEATTPR